MFLNTDDDLNLSMIAYSGQCFRWRELDDGAFFIPHAAHSLIIKEVSAGCFELDCDEKEYDEIWRSYLDMDNDYSSIRKRADRKKDPFMYEAAGSMCGMRILRQDPFEALISFIISQNRNIPAIKNSIELICERSGQLLKDSRGNAFYAFPTAAALHDMSDEALKECRLGYRFDYIKNTAALICDGSFDPYGLDTLDDDECLEKLKSLYGVGPKVASCMLLYGLHRMNAFPIDVWVKRILKDKYPDGFPYDIYSPYCGLFQQYMFAYYRSLFSVRL